MAKFITILLMVLLSVAMPADARKVKQSLKIEKVKTSAKKSASEELGRELSADADTCVSISNGRQVIFTPSAISFAGYEKEANADNETFLVTNNSGAILSAIKIKIIYTDLTDRMLHTRTLTLPCFIPSGETRKIDIRSWDKQHTYFYHLGNEPRKVATPYKIKILPLAFFIKD